MQKSMFVLAVACVLGSVPVAASGWNQNDAKPVWGAGEARAVASECAGKRRRRSRHSAAKQASVDPHVALKPGATPADVLARTPKGARSLGFATAPLGPGGAPVLLHFHGVPPHDPQESSYDRVDLDVYTRAHNGGLKRLKSFSGLTQNLESDGKVNFEMVEVLWLQPRSKRGPILLVDRMDCRVLPQGWSGPARELILHKYSSDAGTVNFFLNSTDSRGYARLRVDGSSRSGLDLITGPDGGTAESVSSYLYWNGRDFVPGKS
jgi:hypothetical protein